MESSSTKESLQKPGLKVYGQCEGALQTFFDCHPHGSSLVVLIDSCQLAAKRQILNNSARALKVDLG